jgi:hypothetical protein
MKREYYKDRVANFLTTSSAEILGKLVQGSEFPTEPAQRDAWLQQIDILKRVLSNLQLSTFNLQPTGRNGRIYFEYSVPRMGKRIDVLLLVGPVLFVLEFKVGEKEFTRSALDQVWDYALDLKNFHESSRDALIAPILIATRAGPVPFAAVSTTPHNDKLLSPNRCNAEGLAPVIEAVLSFTAGEPEIDADAWERGRYCPTSTIIEAALALYKRHSVTDISRNEAGDNLDVTSKAISGIISASREGAFKSICFVTGVPGSGKTLVGLNIATKHHDKEDNLYSVFLSGNGPLVAILREALARDSIQHEKALGRKVKRGEARTRVKAFIQNVHHFRDECLIDLSRPPVEHVALFDEAQRAWHLAKTSDFMRRKKRMPNFEQSEPEFLISCLDRHQDWAVIVCLVGGGQEINTGEAGISEWIDSLNRSFPDWRIYISSRLTDSEYGAGRVLQQIKARPHLTINDDMHLSVSMRSFRAENVSHLVKQLLDLDAPGARDSLKSLRDKYPIVITRDLTKAKRWLKTQARGSERYGIVVSSQAERLKPHAIDVKSPMDPIHWFLDGKEDVRSSYYLEDVATEFDIQGLELDWACVTWDADFRHTSEGWQHWSFIGDRWNHIRKAERQTYLKNAYRVLLTRARQGMVIVVPPGDSEDPTRPPDFYDPTFDYLKGVGFTCV